METPKQSGEAAAAGVESQTKARMVESVLAFLNDRFARLSDTSLVIFGSILMKDGASQDIDLWVEGSLESENFVAAVMAEHQSQFGLPIHLILSGKLVDLPDLDAANRWRVAHTGQVAQGQLPTYPPDISEADVDLIYKSYALAESKRLARQALEVALTDSWSDGSFVVGAARRWLRTKASDEAARRELKMADRDSLAAALAKYDPELYSLINTHGWEAKDVAVRISALINND